MYQADTRRKILNYERQYRTSAERMAELRLQEDLHILKDAQVVGMTTTGKREWGALSVTAKFTVVPQILSGYLGLIERASSTGKRKNTRKSY